MIQKVISDVFQAAAGDNQKNFKKHELVNL